MDREWLRALLGAAAGAGASDVHLSAEARPTMRVDGGLTPVPGFENRTLAADELGGLLPEVLDERQREAYERRGQVDLSLSFPGVGRFRLNVYRQRGTPALALRLIPFEIRSLEELGLPPAAAELARQPNGLVLVTGPTGSGKTTTLAAMVDLINRERSLHIVTLEDPIEILHRHRRSLVNQREIGSDVASFADGLRAALREDPDVILVGEMRDLETIGIALRASETGHLVLASLHTQSAPLSVDRIIDVFPSGQQEQVRVQLAGALRGILCQQLLPRVGGGRVAAVEVLVATPAVRNLIRENKAHQLESAMQTGARYGMRTMEAAMAQLASAGLVHLERDAALK